MRHALTALALIAGLAAAPAAAQSDELDNRLDRVERELRAVQRQVFPGGSPQFFEPEIPGQQPTQPTTGGSTAPIADLTARISALEAQLADLTNQVEENGFRLRNLEERMNALSAATPSTPPGFEEPDNRLETPIEGLDPPTAESPATGDVPEDEPPAAEEPPQMDLPPGGPIGPAGADEDLPSDAGEASYVRGYRLWRDGNYTAAQASLRQTIEEYPGHRFESYARNLLGRAYLDDDKPANATEIFVANYRDIPNGERAADSLFYLGVALTRLNYPDRACLAFQELQEVYGTGLRSDISEQLPAARRAARCE